MIPYWLISIVAVTGGILGIYNFLHFNHDKSTPFLKIGLVVLSPIVIMFGILYFSYVGFISETLARQFWVRLGMLIYNLAFMVWQLIIITGGKNDNR